MWNRVGPPSVQKEALLHLPPFGDKNTRRRSSGCSLVTLQQRTAPLIRVMCSGTHCPPRSSAPQRGFGPSLSPAGSEVVWGSWDWRRPCSENDWLDPEWENSTSWASPELRPSPPHQTASVVRNRQMKRKRSACWTHSCSSTHQQVWTWSLMYYVVDDVAAAERAVDSCYYIIHTAENWSMLNKNSPPVLLRSPRPHPGRPWMWPGSLQGRWWCWLYWPSHLQNRYSSFKNTFQFLFLCTYGEEKVKSDQLKPTEQIMMMFISDL